MVTEIFQTLALFPRDVTRRYVDLRLAGLPIRAAAAAAMAEHLRAGERRVLVQLARRSPPAYSEADSYTALVRLGLVAVASTTRVGSKIAQTIEDSSLVPLASGGVSVY